VDIIPGEIMSSENIRPIAICVVRRDGDIFVFEARDTIKGETFYRPLGGGIEYQERSEDAVRREMREELGAEITGLRQIGVLENIFTYQGRPGHEIVFVFRADFSDRAIYDLQTAMGIKDNDEPFPAIWTPMEEFASGRSILYPEGLLELLLEDPNGGMIPGAGGAKALRNKPVK
jgi:8-oxo-dGTP pyrophosphatase MutT (NUDIX family)